MKLFLFLTFCITVASSSFSQHYYTDSKNRDMLRQVNSMTERRAEFILPEVNGYKAYKGDLHIHTVFSDAFVMPQARVIEAWTDGLDFIAITDHIEYRTNDKKMVEYLADNLPKGIEITDNNMTADFKDVKIKSDLNYATNLASKYAGYYGITVIPGTEVTRNSRSIGHFNALFTTDNNKIYVQDPMQSLRNAKAQGALIVHNHPGWKRTSLDPNEFEQKAYSENLIDGIEIMNDTEFYPKAIDIAKKNGFFMSSNTDIHEMSGDIYRMNGFNRNMTFIFAKDKSLSSLREALEARRTLAYWRGTVAGEEQLLLDLAKASLSLERTAPGVNRATLTNGSSLQFVMRAGGNELYLAPLSSIIVDLDKDGKFTATIENFWTGENSHPVLNLATTAGSE